MSDDRDLRVSVDALRGSVDDLGDKVDAERAARVGERASLERKQLTAALALEASKRSNRRANLALGAAVLILLVGLLAQWWQSDSLRREVERREADRTHALVVSCQNANVTRQAIEDRFVSFIDVLVAVSSPPSTPEQAEARGLAVDRLRAEFAARRPEALGQRDCTVAAVTAPTTLTTLAPGR